MTFALDATYSIGDELSGVGIYSREILYGLARAHSDTQFAFYYRPHRYLRARSELLPPNVRRRLLAGPLISAEIFHGLNQRLPRARLKRAIATFHDLFVMTGDYSTAEFRERFTAQARDAAARAQAIIAVSAFTRSQVISLLGVEPRRVHVVHHGVRRLDLPPPAREKIVLSVGAVQKRKNTHRLIEAFRALDSSWKLVLAGSAGHGAETILAGIPDRVMVTGYISAEELGCWYSKAAIFAFPSLDEGFGMPVLEAMAAGIPVIASNRSALPEVAGDAAILTDPEDTDALAAALRLLAEDEDLRNRLVQKGRARAGLFTWKKAVEETWSVYCGLLS